MPPQLNAIEQILPYRIHSWKNRRQRVQIGIRHPYSHCRILLTEQLSSSDDVAVLVADEFSQTELNRAENHRCDAEPDYGVNVLLSFKKHEINSLTKRYRQRQRPQVKRQSFYFTKEIVDLRQEVLTYQSHKERKSYHCAYLLDNQQK